MVLGLIPVGILIASIFSIPVWRAYMKLRRYVLAAAAGIFGLTASVQAAIVTDFIFVVDESGSMGSVQANLRNQIGNFAQVLSSGGVDARYGLVGYGNNAVVPRQLTDLTTAANFATAAANLVASGGTEPGYQATAFALNKIDGQTSTFSFRANSIINIILFTDEPSNGEGSGGQRVGGAVPSLTVVDGLLDAEDAFFNAVLTGTNTIASYKPLADNNSGQVFDLQQFATLSGQDLTKFVQDFAAAKLKEVQDFCDLNPTDPACVGNIPVPGTLLLVGLGLATLRIPRRLS